MELSMLAEYAFLGLRTSMRNTSSWEGNSGRLYVDGMRDSCNNFLLTISTSLNSWNSLELLKNYEC